LSPLLRERAYANHGDSKQEKTKHNDDALHR
jgi:hypothetical protein